MEREGAANGRVSSEVEAGKGKRGAELGMHGQDRKSQKTTRLKSM